MKFFDSYTIDRIRRGYYTAVYFNRTKYILEREKNFKVATMQVFQKHEGSILCGVEEVVELLKVGVGYCKDKQQITNNKQQKSEKEFKDWNSSWVDKFDTLKIEALKDGDRISAGETVMHITGPYVYFAHLESLYLGILARRTTVATNVRKTVEAANGKPVIFFADRFDYFLNQEGDGYAAHIGGASGVCTLAHTAWWGADPSGTIPHSLIALNDGDTVKATELFDKYYGKEAKVIALVDFDNDCVKTSLEVARKLGRKLWGVRLDTAQNLIDRSLRKNISNIKYQKENRQIIDNREKLYGVNPSLVRLVRKALDENGCRQVKIVVSGGFHKEKIQLFEKEKAPVDVYGVGSALVHGENDFTADIVEVEGKEVAKAGRKKRENPRMKTISH